MPTVSTRCSYILRRSTARRLPIRLGTRRGASAPRHQVVFAPDAGEGHALAAERGKPGARYILSERYYTLKDLATQILAALAVKRNAPRVLPLWLCSFVSTIGEWKAGITGKPPLIPKGQLEFLQVDSYPTAKRATEELGLSFTPLGEGLAKTIEWMKANGKLVEKKQLVPST